MEDRRIEDLLRQSWNPEPPEGMRERVLRRGREELSRKRCHWWGMSPFTWKLVFASVGVVLVVFSFVAEVVRESRIHSLSNGLPPARVICTEHPGNLLERRKSIDYYIVIASLGTGATTCQNGDDSL